MTQCKMKYRIGCYVIGELGDKKWKTIKTIRRATDTEAEAEIDNLFGATPLDDDGDVRVGLYIRRGDAKWFRRFSYNLIANYPRSLTPGGVA